MTQEIQEVGDMARNRLTGKQARFCREYIIDCNATQAAIRAGYSKKAAKEQGSRLLANVSIKGRIAELQAPILEKHGIDADYVIENLKATHDDCIEAKDRTNRLRSLELLGRHLNLFADKREVTATLTLAQAMAGIDDD